MADVLDLKGRIAEALETGPSTALDPGDPEVAELRSLGASGAEAGAVRFRCGTRAFVKRYLGEEAADRLRAEAAGLHALAEVLPRPGGDHGFSLRVPRVLRAEPNTGLLLCEWIDVVSAPRDEAAFARALATMQRQSVSHAPSRPGFEVTTFLGETPQDNRGCEAWPTFFVERRLRVMHRMLVSTAPQGLLSGLERLCEQAGDMLAESAEPIVLLHGDLWSGNLLWTRDGVALIDPAASWGHREAELGMLTLFGGLDRAFYDQYQQAWPLAPGWQRRVAVYRLYHVLNHRVLFGSTYDGSALRLIAELADG